MRKKSEVVIKNIVSNCLDDLFTITLYKRTQRILVQPGNQEEKNLLKFIDDLTSILSLRLSLVKSTVSSTRTEESENYTQNNKKQENPGSAGLTNEPTGSELKVSLPPLPKMNTNTTNELLCFTQNRMQSLPVDNIIKLCVDFYSAEEITVTKKLLFDQTDSIRPS